MGDNGTDKVLEAIKGLDTKLISISTDVQQLNSKTEHLNSLYESLKKQFQANEKKHNENWKSIDRRLDKLEGEQSKLPTQAQLDALREDLAQDISEKVETSLSESRTLALENMNKDLAINMNRAMEAIDATESKSKKLNLVVSGLTEDKNNLEAKTRELFSEKFGVNEEITQISVIESTSKAIVTLKNWETKLKSVKSKREKLANSKIFIQRDLTEREQRIGAKLREVARNKKREGYKVMLAFPKICIQEQWYDWDEFNNRIVPGEPPSANRGNKLYHLTNKAAQALGREIDKSN